MKSLVGIVSLLIFGIFFQEVKAQQFSDIRFEVMDHAFGKIKEEAGPVNFNFKFTNTGKIPLLIQGVEASCGCTTPEWSKEPVLPGKNGLISVSYNPEQRPGTFAKSITVTANVPKAVRVLTISGEVIPHPVAINDLYPFDFGKLRFSSGELSFVRIKDNEIKTDTIRVYNPGTNPVSLNFKIIPGWLTIKPYPEVLQPNSKGILIITFDAKKRADYGYITNRVYFAYNGEEKYNNALMISATIEEDFSKLSAADLANAPRIDFNNRTFDFKEISAGQSVYYTFTISNKGKRDLIIRSVTASCGCTSGKPASNIIPPGGNTELKVSFDSYGKTGLQNKIITIITNDPEHSTTLLRVIGNVKDNN